MVKRFAWLALLTTLALPVSAALPPLGWAPFECESNAPGRPRQDHQRQGELKLIPHPEPTAIGDFLENFRDFELRQSLAPDWKWVRHLPWIRDRYLTSTYGKEVGRYFDGTLRARLLAVENWDAERCDRTFDNRGWIVVQLISREGGLERTRIAFRRDGTWAQAHAVAPETPDPMDRLRSFRLDFRAVTGTDATDALLVSFISPLCRTTTPCVAAHWGDRVLIGGWDRAGLYLLDLGQPVVNDVLVGDTRPMAMVGSRQFRLLVPLQDGRGVGTGD